MPACLPPLVVSRFPRPSRARPRGLLCALALALAGAGARAQATSDAVAPAIVAAAPSVQRVEVSAHYLNGVGTSDAASEGIVTSSLIASRPTLRPAEVLEFVPGVIVTQHSGDGKANQYFLRGFDLDHGTDFATFVDGMPVNMPTHAHGQGYSDLNWLIPELVDRITYRKGPYFAQEGDFSSAGSARIALFDALPSDQVTVTRGQQGYARGLFAGSRPVGDGEGGGRLLGALELAHDDGPWEHPEKFHRVNGLLRFSRDDEDTRWSLTAMGYDAAWDATDQVPVRAVSSGLIGRFGAIDPTDGGRTSRASLSFNASHRIDGPWEGDARVSAYAIRSSLDLFSDFTYFLVDPVHGDQFEQAEQRRVLGLDASRSFDGSLLGRATRTTVGLQLRQDRLDPVGLYRTMSRLRLGTVQESLVRETAGAVYLENATSWAPGLRTIAGGRLDHEVFAVDSSILANGGRRAASLASPKLSVVLGPWSRTEFFLNAGAGFHSNDARGATETVSPSDGLPARPVDPLVRTRGAELGLRTEPVDGLQASVAAWVLDLDSELVFSGDAGDTQASRASQRHGLEVNGHYAASRRWLIDADLSLSQARYTQADASGSSIPGAIRTVASFGATLKSWGPWSGQFELRWFGPRPLVEDDSLRSKASLLASLRVGYALAPSTKLALDCFNLFDRRASDIDYAYASRLPGEASGGVEDVHFHPVEPRSVRLTFTQAW